MNSFKKYQYNLLHFLLIWIVGEILFWGLVLLGWQYLENNQPSFQFEHPKMLYAIAFFMPLLTASYLYLKIWRNKAIKRYAQIDLLESITRGFSNSKSLLKYLLLRFGTSLLLIAAANPQFGTKERDVVSKGIDIMIALDVSNSMLAEDLVKEKSRLYIAKKGIAQLLDKLHGDHIGIVVFAGDAFKQLPITPDYNVAKMFLNNINTDMISAQGTDIGNAIEECMTSFDFDKPTNKVIVVFSDGEDHEEKALEVAKEANDQGVMIHTIGMGSLTGTPIPMYNNNGTRIGFRSDENGQTVLTKLNENVLIDVADAGGGSYTRANGYSIGLDKLVDQIDSVEKTELNKDKFLSYSDHFQIFLLLGLICLVIDSLITEKRNNGFFNLFKPSKK